MGQHLHFFVQPLQGKLDMPCLLYTSGNLNQITRTLNEWHSPYPQLAGEVRAVVSDLAALKFEVLQKVGRCV